MGWLGDSLSHAAAMLWEMLWALVLGFSISAALQVLVSRERISALLGGNGWRPVLLATGLGAASSSCSYAAAAAMRTVFQKGAGFVAAIALLISATNLVIELGIVLWNLMGWVFVAAEIVGAAVMIALAALLVKLTAPRAWLEQARTRGRAEASCHDHGEAPARSPLERVADAFVMDWSMLWREILGGALIAGFLMTLVPPDGWRALFLVDGPYALRVIENAVVGPLIALASFVCSVGNVPLAALLWSSGCSFGGVVAFIYGDLIVLPLILVYGKYYGAKFALYLAGVLFVSMVGAGVVVDLLFTALDIVPSSRPAAMLMDHATFRWNYTTWLDFVALAVAATLLAIHFRRPSERGH